jgi:hypothetical protein
MKTYKIILIALTVLLIAAGITTSCIKEEVYNKSSDLFQPRLINTEVVDTNNLALVWYEVKNAVSYTIELHLENYYRSLFATYEVNSTVFYLPDLPYATQFYIRIRSNSASGKNNSTWAYTSAATLVRPTYAHILQSVTKADITDNTVTLRWTLDAHNPADSASLVPLVTTYGTIGRYLTSDEKTQGSALINGLVKGALYKVNIYDTSKPRKYDKPYNEVTFRTTGGVPDTIYINRDDDLSAILAANDKDVTVTEGDVYVLPAGSFYKVSPFAITKGFKLLGSTGGSLPQIELGAAWNVAEGSMISTFSFENIAFYQIVASSYFFNANTSFTIDNVSIYNCTFKTFQRGFWRHQTAKLKHIKSITLENVTMDQCGASNSYGTFAIGSTTSTGTAMDNMERVVITNCTFMRQIGGMKNLFDYGYTTYPIDLEFHHITLYSYAISNKLINMPNAYGSTLVIDGMLLASNSGAIYTIPSGITTSFTNNYGTTDYLPGLSLMNGTALGISAAALFTDAANGDLSIKDPNSPIVTKRAGDTRWLP